MHEQQAWQFPPKILAVTGGLSTSGGEMRVAYPASRVQFSLALRTASATL